jgi:hypothetical protein
MFRRTINQFRKSFRYVQNPRIGKSIYDPDLKGKVLREMMGLKNVAKIEKEIARREAYSDAKHSARDIIVHGVVAPAVGLALTKLVENTSHHLNGNLRGSDLVGYGFPLICKQVASTVTENPVTSVTYQPWNLVGNAVVWVAISEAASYVLLKGINHYQLRQLEKKWKELTRAPNTHV